MVCLQLPVSASVFFFSCCHRTQATPTPDHARHIPSPAMHASPHGDRPKLIRQEKGGPSGPLPHACAILQGPCWQQAGQDQGKREQICRQGRLAEEGRELGKNNLQKSEFLCSEKGQSQLVPIAAGPRVLSNQESPHNPPEQMHNTPSETSTAISSSTRLCLHPINFFSLHVQSVSKTEDDSVPYGHSSHRLDRARN
ncbi:hypothetical protein BDY21DRAFT_10491 [Lineolata rhizophorae]|uniref:Uncharacterized protein n=1 Tax=Lineolata rhizophorae TaxID=578093 RepID=A0A6A6PEQ9_9PEZI|nr:hypothetical protein BDY21DRAFT_10491 [Lineolata rhizophorae]